MLPDLVEFKDGVNKINLGLGRKASEQLTGISHREDGRASNMDRETHMKE